MASISVKKTLSSLMDCSAMARCSEKLCALPANSLPPVVINEVTRHGYWEVRKSGGCTYRIGKWWQRMPEVDESYLNCSIYLYRNRWSAEKGEEFGGSGCLVSIESARPYYPHVYAVTCAHTIRDGFTVIRLNTVKNEKGFIELEKKDWIMRPKKDDLAVAPLDLHEVTYDYRTINRDVSFLTRDYIEGGKNTYGVTVGAGADTFMVGRFINHAGRQRNTPSLRFGSIAMLPFEAVELRDGFEQEEAFLVEVRSISGYSGSPVFVYMPTYGWDSDTGHYYITEPIGWARLLGIDCAHILNKRRVLIPNTNPKKEDQPHQEGWYVDSNTGMAVVIPAWRLNDLLNVPKLRKQRKERDKRLKAEDEADKRKGKAAFDD